MNPEQKDVNSNFIPGVCGVSIHDVIVLHKKLRVEGEGHSWYQFDKLGVVTEIGEDRLKMVEPDGEFYEYELSKLTSDDESKYVYSVSKGSEIEYQNAIDESIADAKKKVERATEEVRRLEEWRSTFEYSISILGRMARFIKAFK